MLAHLDLLAAPQLVSACRSTMEVLGGMCFLCSAPDHVFVYEAGAQHVHEEHGKLPVTRWKRTNLFKHQSEWVLEDLLIRYHLHRPVVLNVRGKYLHGILI